METFIFAAICAVAVNSLLLVSCIEVSGEEGWVRIRLGGTFRVAIARRVLNLIVVTLSLLLLFFVVLVALGAIHPRERPVYGMAEFFLGRRFAGVALGFLFGTLLVFWMRQLLLLGRNDPPTWTHRAEAVLLVALFVLGTFSEAISSYARRITQISAAGLSLTFDPQRSAGASPRGQPNSGAILTGGERSGSSIGALGFLADMKGLIERDRQYIALLRGIPGEASLSTREHRQNEFFGRIVGSMAGCFRALSTEFGEDVEINRRIEPLRPVLRELVATGSLLSREQAQASAERFADVSGMLVEDLGRTYLRGYARDESRKQVSLECVPPLLDVWCPGGSGEGGKLKSLDQAIALLTVCRTDAAARRARAGQWGEILHATATDPTLASQPYLSLLYASLLWRLGEHRLAVHEVEEWLRLESGKSELPHDWYVVRMRTSLVVIFEEWIRSTSNPPVLLLGHHLDNLVASMKAMEKLRAVGEAWRAFSEKGYDAQRERFTQAPDWSGLRCSLSPDRRDLRNALAYTYLTQQMVFAYRAAEHRDYFDKYSPHVLRRRDAFRTINLACYYDIHGSDRTDLLNAELLQIYGGIELANAARLAEGTDAEAARRMVQNAADSAALALQIVRGQVADLQEAGKSSTFKATKGGQKALELHDELTQIRQRAQDILRAN